MIIENGGKYCFVHVGNGHNVFHSIQLTYFPLYIFYIFFKNVSKSSAADLLHVRKG